MKEYLSGLIREMVNERKAKHVAPFCVQYSELKLRVLEDMRKPLNELKRDGAIDVHINVNKDLLIFLKE